ncbi:MAG: TAT-variant-translocated molybdopterin oxidoreductase [Holophaga sp.]
MAEPVRTPSDPLSRPEEGRFWRSLEERAGTPAAREAAANEFAPGASDPPTGLSRRRFLELVGATTALATTAACSRGRGGIVPYTRRPPEVVPGVANYYASTFQEGPRSYGVLVKTREGRPIHVTGNDEHPVLRGLTSPRAVADVLRLYDPDRLRGPRLNGRGTSWDEAQDRVVQTLAAARTAGTPVLLLTGALESPTRKALVEELRRALPALRHLAWEPAAGSGPEAVRASFGADLALRPRIAAAKVILSLGCDFLDGSDPAAVRDFAAGRRPAEAGANRPGAPGEKMKRLWALEGPMTLTGGKADHRFPVPPSRLAQAAFALARDLKEKHGVPTPAGVDLGAAAGGPGQFGIPPAAWDALLADLKGAGGAALVLCGDRMPVEAHQAAHLLNAMLRVETLEAVPAEPLATARDLAGEAEAMAAGRYAAVLLWGVNPAYAAPDPGAWAAALERVPLRVWIGLQEDETAARCQILLPEHHWLEAWGDHDGGDGCLTLQQPAVGPLYDTRQGEDVLLALLRGVGADLPADYHAYLKARWQREVYPGRGLVPFPRWFDTALHDGVVSVPTPSRPLPVPAAAALDAAAAAAGRPAHANASAAPADFELVLQPGAGVHDGRYGNNAWIQEFPDPATKSTWGNPLAVSVQDAASLGLKDGDLVTVTAGKASLETPVLVQPGQAPGVLALALGYGRQAGRVAKGIGANAFPLQDPACAGLRLGVRISPPRPGHPLPITQGHHRLEGRDLVHSFSLAEYARKKVLHKPSANPPSLYPDQVFPEHKWGMVIDLSACVGCSACVLACQSENNVPVVGPEQVIVGREMHWIRIDRYYEGPPENPRVVQQPMLCQHCDDAPCENVCPVNATNHSSEGLNQMVYNRCVGTRYCANNCPYKVRRFNFLEYTAYKREPESLVYNPEVTVRPRGVMEKCTFCVQRIEDGRLRAKAERRPVRDGEIVTACAAACPAQAIVFGDLKDPDSQVSRLSRSDRGFKVLDELGTRPAITYLANLRNPALEGEDHES